MRILLLLSITMASASYAIDDAINNKNNLTPANNEERPLLMRGNVQNGATRVEFKTRATTCVDLHCGKCCGIKCCCLLGIVVAVVCATNGDCCCSVPQIAPKIMSCVMQ